ncbi:MAG: hypothetical protein ABI578_05565 [Chloroflexota bacterium]
MLLAGSGAGISAGVDIPPAGGFYIQTSGPNAPVTIGDWYSSNLPGAGNGYHYISVNVPCGWPSGTPLMFDLFSPEMNANGAVANSDEPRGVGPDTTQFELYGPGATVGPGYDHPLPGTGIAVANYSPEPLLPESWVRFVTLNPPVACGSYLVRSAVTGAADDDNGWRIRVGTDNDSDPTNAPPANSDNPDGIPGTNDEIVIGEVQVSYQQSTGGVACLTLFEYVPAGQPSVTFHNFDMDGNTRVRYYAPSDAFDATGLTGGTVGTLSNNGVWNSGTLARVGDTIANPEGGWWRIVSCLSAGNQFIQEGQNGVRAFYSQPPTPVMTLTKDDGTLVAPAGGDLTYTVTASNTSSGATAGAALAVVITDTIPTNSTFQSCAIVAPATGTCSEALGVVTATLNGWIDAGSSAAAQITVTVDGNASGTITNDASVAFQDALGNSFPPVTANDVDTAGPPLPTPTPSPTPTVSPTPTPLPTPTVAATSSVPDTGLDPTHPGELATALIFAALGILLVGLLGLASLAERLQRGADPRRVR